ncbi:1,4-dihydroxy-2-naphthoate polyprenyltransferase [Galactobacter caseinivorans]|uniref:1,4-dihydroxy-2-naphthoate octaprenyltransferase n=1 Tax=Galactobacter caseinivorans TaxID=2676123 RepID=A0A496PLE6_9MICC|nr:1,4-dihydroxy-2-naphthoate polyprenyltransferase [Galactobacter caseinivorans]RKW71353.1 1,4-dihydroxy-2-naphthoate polyprenyltransferase [Galactobacter caseinivorans]
MATPAQWIAGARLRTLPMAIAPVAVGTAAAFGLTGAFHWVLAILALLVSLLLQIGVNYANDYSDGVRGTDDDRVGPLRLTGSRLAKPSHVKAASFICFGLAALVGLLLIFGSGVWPLLLVGVAAIFAAWGYTGGKHPYGYLGLGEVFVFLFFGLVATLGTTLTQVHQLPLTAWLGAVSTGLIAMALLMANNIRDIPTDREVGKNTLAVRLGEHAARVSYAFMLGVAAVLPVLAAPSNPWLLLTLVVLALSVAPVRRVMTAQHAGELIPVLKQTGIIAIVFAALFSVASALPFLLA